MMHLKKQQTKVRNFNLHLTCEMNLMVVILLSLYLEENIGCQFGVMGHFGGIVLVLPLELKDGVLLEIEGHHCDILFICVIGVVQSRGEYGRLLLLKSCVYLGYHISKV